MTRLNRRLFLQRTVAAAARAPAHHARAADAVDLKPLEAEVSKRHEEAIQRLQNWIRQPAIAAENRGMNEGCDLMMRMLRDAGFDRVSKVSTAGHPGVFATLAARRLGFGHDRGGLRGDAGAPKTVGIYFIHVRRCLLQIIESFASREPMRIGSAVRGGDD